MNILSSVQQIGQIVVDSTTPTAFPAFTLVPKNGVILKAPTTNDDIVYVGIGGATITDYPLEPGDVVPMLIMNPKDLKFLAVTDNDVVAYILS